MLNLIKKGGMMKKIFTGLLLTGICFMLFTTQLFSTEEKEKKRSLATEISYVSSSGNSEISTANVDVLYQQNWTRTIFKLDGSFLFSTQGSTTTAEQYHLGEKVEYSVGKKMYLFEYGEWLKNHFIGLNNQYKLQGGAGYWLVDKEFDKLKSELGAGYTVEDIINISDGSSQIEYGSYRMYGEYKHLFSQAAVFSLECEFAGNMEESDDYKVDSTTALTTALSRSLSSKISYNLKYAHQPVTGFEKTDTILTAALILKL